MDLAPLDRLGRTQNDFRNLRGSPPATGRDRGPRLASVAFPI